MTSDDNQTPKNQPQQDKNKEGSSPKPSAGPWGAFDDKNKGADRPSASSGNPWMQKPWASAGRDQGRSSSQKSGNGYSGGGDFGSEPPNLRDLFDKFTQWQGAWKPKGHGHAFLIALAVLVGLWMLSGFYLVGTDQQGVVMRFGAYHRSENPGLRYHWPAPIEEVFLPTVTSQNEIQIGFRRSSRDDSVRPVPQESLMLTQDENVIDVGFAVFWRISDIGKFLFEIRDPERTIKMAAESVMREVIGQNKLQFALTDGRSQIADEARKRLQGLMDEYQTGIVVTQINLQTVSVPEEVKEAFQDVINARLEQERMQNDAAKHVNEVIPAAKGEAAQITQQALAYRDQKIAIAQGEAQRFREVLSAYVSARDVTAKRLYLETMESILSSANKIVMDRAVGSVPMFPLQDLMKAKGDEAKSGDAGRALDGKGAESKAAFGKNDQTRGDASRAWTSTKFSMP